jgi:hypothetical protein
VEEEPPPAQGGEHDEWRCRELEEKTRPWPALPEAEAKLNIGICVKPSPAHQQLERIRLFPIQFVRAWCN